MDVYAAAAFLGPLAVYLLTLAPSTYWLDSGIYLAAARELGVAYPPGFPLYVLLGHGFGQIPLGSLAQRVHALSALAGALACLATYGTVLVASQAQGPPRLVRVHALLAAWTLGFSFALWSQSVNSEVYSLQALVTALLILFFARLDGGPARPFRSAILPLALTAGLGFANHPMIVAMLPALGFAVWRHRAHARSWLAALPVFLAAGLLPYAYIPLRSLANPLTDWGDPETAGNFLRLVTATHWTAEASSFSFFGAGFWVRGAACARLFFLQFWPVGLLLGAVGAWRLRVEGRGLLVFLALTGAFAILIPLLYTQTKEFESWFLAAYVAFAPCVGLGGARAARGAAALWARGPQTAAVLVTAAAAAGAPILLFLTALPAANRSCDHDAEDYGAAILGSVDENGILFLSGDNPSSTVLYLQAVLDRRRDVAVVNQEALQSPWYRGYVRKNLALSVPEPESATAAVPVTDLVLAIMAAHPDRPAFALMPRHLALPEEIRVVPCGMVFRLGGGGEPPPLARWDFFLHDPDALTRARPRDQRGRIEESIREMRAGFLRAYNGGGDFFAARGDRASALRLYAAADRIVPMHEDVFLRAGVERVAAGDIAGAREIFEGLVARHPTSAKAYLNLGHVRAEQGDRDGARRAYEKALELDPGFSLARKALDATATD